MEKHLTHSQSLKDSATYQFAKKALLEVIAEKQKLMKGCTPSQPELKNEFQVLVDELKKNRGRELYFPFISSGFGNGVLVELCDGSVKYDLITGIGINWLGHSHPELMSEIIDAVPSDVMQGNLLPGIESHEILKKILSLVGKESRLKNAWLSCSGTTSNENALKIVRQKHFPATRVFAFTDCFAGRSTAMSEINDNPKYREGQPTYGEVSYLPFFDSKLGLERSIDLVISHMQFMVDRYPQKYAALMIEIVQGEGGFKFAPREWYVKIFEAAKKMGLAIWTDEVQTFGRTGELFAFQTFDLAKYIDVCTIGKSFQACAVLFSEEYNPRAGLVAGTFTGSSATLRAGKKVLDILESGGFLGKGGKIETRSNYFVNQLKKLQNNSLKGLIPEIRAIGGMIAFQPFSGTMDQVKALLMTLFDKGVIAFYCGHDPYFIRMLPPLPVMSEVEIDLVIKIIEEAMLETSKEVLK